jgi:hypothetical protein
VLNTLLEGTAIYVPDGVSVDQMNTLAAYSMRLQLGSSYN